MLKVVHDAEASDENTASGSLLDQIVRDGARQMLAVALQAEVAAYIESFADEVDDVGRRLVVRNGFHAESPSSEAAHASRRASWSNIPTSTNQEAIGKSHDTPIHTS